MFGESGGRKRVDQLLEIWRDRIQYNPKTAIALLAHLAISFVADAWKTERQIVKES